MNLIKKLFDPVLKRKQTSPQVQQLKKQIRSLRMTVILIFILAIILIFIATKPLTNKDTKQNHAMIGHKVNFQRISLT